LTSNLSINYVRKLFVNFLTDNLTLNFFINNYRRIKFVDILNFSCSEPFMFM